MLDLKNITLISVACIRVERAIDAMRFSMKEINFGSCKIFTSENIQDDAIQVIKINPLDYIGYNHFIVYELWKYIDTDFVLLVQDDGFVVHPKSWSDKFLDYDYIGAPWPLPNDSFSYRDHFGNIVRVGNGGFSLRSKKILKLPTQLNLEWKSYFGFYNEDGFFTCHNRHIFEQNGCVFSPIEVAVQFSHELPIIETLNILPFGFHGKNNNYYNLI